MAVAERIRAVYVVAAVAVETGGGHSGDGAVWRAIRAVALRVCAVDVKATFAVETGGRDLADSAVG